MGKAWPEQFHDIRRGNRKGLTRFSVFCGEGLSRRKAKALGKRPDMDMPKVPWCKTFGSLDRAQVCLLDPDHRGALDLTVFRKSAAGCEALSVRVSLRPSPRSPEIEANFVQGACGEATPQPPPVSTLQEPNFTAQLLAISSLPTLHESFESALTWSRPRQFSSSWDWTVVIIPGRLFQYLKRLTTDGQWAAGQEPQPPVMASCSCIPSSRTPSSRTNTSPQSLEPLAVVQRVASVASVAGNLARCCDEALDSFPSSFLFLIASCYY